MSANSQLPTLQIKEWLETASNKLANTGISSSALDSELILCYVLKTDRTCLHAHPEEEIEALKLAAANDFLEQRLKRIPLAYIISEKGFYGRNFTVNQSVLIPRPESEVIIDILKSIIFIHHAENTNSSLIDVGTGSGCLGITAKLEIPQLDVVLIDISDEALLVAEKNARELSAKVKILQSDLLEKFDAKADVIVANLPYVDRNWERSPETDYEPDLALFADDSGMSLIKKLISQCESKLKKSGHLIIESDATQHKKLIEYANKQSLKHIQTTDLALVFSKIN